MCVCVHEHKIGIGHFKSNSVYLYRFCCCYFYSITVSSTLFKWKSFMNNTVTGDIHAFLSFFSSFCVLKIVCCLSNKFSHCYMCYQNLVIVCRLASVEPRNDLTQVVYNCLRKQNIQLLCSVVPVLFFFYFELSNILWRTESETIVNLWIV